VQVRANYANHTWALFTTNNRTMVTNNIGFINSNLTTFAGFDVYNGGLSTSYLDNVLVTIPATTNSYLNVTPTTVQTNSVMRGYTTNLTLNIANDDPVNNMGWGTSTTDTWIQMSATYGTVAAGSSNNLVATNSAVTLAAGTYTGSVVVAATNADIFIDPESAVVTFVLQVMELKRLPAQLTNTVMQGDWTTNSFEIWNAGPGVLTYSVATNQPWLTLSPSADGSLTGQTVNATNTIVVTYTNTAELPVGANYGTITISAAGGGSVTLDVILTVRAVPMLNVSPALITTNVMEGQNLASQSLLVWNGSADDGIGYQVTTNQGNASTDWLSVVVTNNYSLAKLTTNTLTINYAVSSLTATGDVPSNYFGSITVTATNTSGSPAIGSPVTIPVTVKVNPKPRLALSLTNLSQTVLQGKDAVSQGFDVWNANGFYTLSYTITTTNAYNSNERIAWLLPTETSGTSTGQHQSIEVQYSTANLPAGITNAVITVVGRAWDGVNWDSALDATQTIGVALSVTPFATLTTDAQSTNFPVRKGVTPSPTVWNVWNGGNLPGDMYFTVTVSPSARSWLSVSPANYTVAGGITQDVTLTYASTAGMAPGGYSGTVQIDATDAESGKPAYGSPQAFTVTIVIRDFKGFDFQGERSLLGASDLLLYREANGAWEIRNLLSNYATTQFLVVRDTRRCLVITPAMASRRWGSIGRQAEAGMHNRWARKVHEVSK